MNPLSAAPAVASPSAMERLDLAAVRAQFPALANQAYFNFGGQGPLPQVAIDGMVEAWQTMQRLGPFSSAVGDCVGLCSAGLLVAPSAIAGRCQAMRTPYLASRALKASTLIVRPPTRRISRRFWDMEPPTEPVRPG